MLMPLNIWGDYMGYCRKHIWNLNRQGRIRGVIRLYGAKSLLVDPSNAEILPQPGRRLDGPVIGRSKPIRGEPGFIDKWKG